MKATLAPEAISTEEMSRLQKQALDRWGRGVVFMGDARKVLLMNRAAEQILRRRDGLEIARGMICAQSSAIAARLKELTEKASEERRNEKLLIPRRQGQTPLIVEVCLATSGEQQYPRAMRFVFITDPDAKLQIDPHLLRTLFRLTQAEVKIASLLAEGRDMKAICRNLAVTPNTARTHLKRLFHKTSTGRQAELVRLLVSLSDA